MPPSTSCARASILSHGLCTGISPFCPRDRNKAYGPTTASFPDAMMPWSLVHTIPTATNFSSYLGPITRTRKSRLKWHAYRGWVTMDELNNLLFLMLFRTSSSVPFPLHQLPRAPLSTLCFTSLQKRITVLSMTLIC